MYLDVGYINVWMLDRRLTDKPTVTIWVRAYPEDRSVCIGSHKKVRNPPPSTRLVVCYEELTS